MFREYQVASMLGEIPSLEQVLQSRELRIQFQSKLMDTYPDHVLVAIKVNMPGEVKNNLLVNTLIKRGKDLLASCYTSQGWSPIYQKDISTTSTVESFAILDTTDLVRVKKAMITIEDTHALGRLYDIDVFQNHETLTRSQLNLPQRRCLICQKSAKACGRSREHTVQALHTKIFEIIEKEGSVRLDEQTG